MASLKLEQQKAVLLGRMKLEVSRCLATAPQLATSPHPAELGLGLGAAVPHPCSPPRLASPPKSPVGGPQPPCTSLQRGSSPYATQDASKTDELKATHSELSVEQVKLEATLAKLDALDSKKNRLKMQVCAHTGRQGRLSLPTRG